MGKIGSDDDAQAPSQGQIKITPDIAGHLIVMQICVLLGKVVNAAVPITGFICAWLAIEALAGKDTSALISLFIDVAVDNNAVTWASLAFGVLGILYGYYERRTRQRTIHRMHAHNLQLEQIIDPNRTSSQLIDGGRTNPNDK